MTKRLSYSRALTLIFFFGFSGCSLMGSSEEPAAPEENAEVLTEAPASVSPPETQKRPSRLEGSSTLEVLWQVPSEAVDKYHFYYGLESDKLDNHIIVTISELQKSDHPKHGPVFRYELRGIPANRAIYLSLRAENKYGISEPSTPTKVEPGQKSVTPK